MSVRDDIRKVLDHEFNINKVVVTDQNNNGLSGHKVSVTWRNKFGETYVSDTFFANANHMTGEHMGEVIASYMRNDNK